MVKTYIKPKIEVIKASTNLMSNSGPKQQCDCYEYREHIGCNGCKGHCGCNHWDGEKIVPGC